MVIAPGTTRTGLVADFRSASADLRAATAAWIDDDLDLRALPHPYLGALTVARDAALCVFHERHHLKRVRASLEPVS